MENYIKKKPMAILGNGHLKGAFSLLHSPFLREVGPFKLPPSLPRCNPKEHLHSSSLPRRCGSRVNSDRSVLTRHCPAIGSRSSGPLGSSSFLSSEGSSGHEFESPDPGGDGVRAWGVPEPGLGCGVKAPGGED